MHVDDGALVVSDKGLGFPDAVALRQVHRETPLEGRRTTNLPGHEQHAVHEHRRSDLLDAPAAGPFAGVEAD